MTDEKWKWKAKARELILRNEIDAALSAAYAEGQEDAAKICDDLSKVAQKVGSTESARHYGKAAACIRSKYDSKPVCQQPKDLQP